jgi:hypothetical protein
MLEVYGETIAVTMADERRATLFSRSSSSTASSVKTTVAACPTQP